MKDGDSQGRKQKSQVEVPSHVCERHGSQNHGKQASLQVLKLSQGCAGNPALRKESK